MRILLTCLILVGLAIGGSYLYWQKQSRIVKQAVTGLFTRLNQLSQARAGVDFIEYADIEVHGYPFEMVFRIQNPTLHIPLTDKQAKTSLVEKHEINGEISIGTNWQGNNFLFQYAGLRTSETLTNGKPHFQRKASLEEPFRCNIELHARNGGFANKPYKSVQNFSGNLTDIREIHCTAAGYELISHGITPQQGYYHLDKADIRWEFEPNDDRSHASLSLQLSNAQVGEMIEPYFDALLPVWEQLGIARGIEKLPRHFFSRTGSNNVTLSGHYDGPRDKIDFTTPFELALDELTIQNTLLSGTANFSIRSVEEEENDNANPQHIQIEARNRMQFSRLYDSLYREQLVGRLLQDRPIITLLGMTIDLRRLSDAQIRQLADDLLPSFAALSPLSVQLSAKGGLKKPGEPILGNRITAQLKDMTLQTNQWLLQLAGDAQLGKKAQLKAVCQKCDALLTELKQLLKQYDKWRMISLNSMQPLVTEAFLHDLDRFMSAVSAGKMENMSAQLPSFNQLQFSVEFGQLTPLINGLSLQQLNTMLDEFLAPHLSVTYPERAQQQPAYQPALPWAPSALPQATPSSP